jgi:RNA polymerase sigma-32 factor
MERWKKMNNDAEAYVNAARNMPLLDREQEAELLRRFRADGDRRAADAIARAHQRSVVSLALKLRRYDVSLADLIAEGNLGLLRALEKFELERGVRFGTYAAHWIRALMLAHVIKSRSLVGGTAGAWRSQLFFKVRRERARVTSQFGIGAVADRELAGRLGVSLERVQNMLQRLDNRDVSIEGSVGDWGKSLLDRLEAESNQEEELFEHQFEHSAARAVHQALGVLDARELFIVRHRLMTSDSEAMSLAHVARHFGISRERARQLESRAITKLRCAIRDAKSPPLHEWLRDTFGRDSSSVAAA